MTVMGRTSPRGSTHLLARVVVVGADIVPVRRPKHDRTLDVA